MDATAEEQQEQQEPDQQQNPAYIVDVWADITASDGINDGRQYRQPSFHEVFSIDSSSGDLVTSPDFMPGDGAVPAPSSPQQHPSSDASRSLQVARGKQKVVDETPELDKAAQRKKRIIKNREFAKSREHEKILREAALEQSELDRARHRAHQLELARARLRAHQQAYAAELEKLVAKFLERGHRE